MISVANLARLVQLASDLAGQRKISIHQAIEELISMAGTRAPQRPRALSGAQLGRFVERLRRIRLRRNELVGAPLFRDPAWDMLLDLFAAHQQGHQVSISSLCYASGVSQSTALRHMNWLERHGLVERVNDPCDLRRSWVRATPPALSGVERTIELLIAGLADSRPETDGTAGDL